MPEEKSINGGELNPAIITQDDEFNKFLMTLPENQRQTPESKYYTYKMWKIAGKPNDFNQAVDMGLYHWNDDDKTYHGNSVIYDEESDTYHFLKPKDHSTVQYELDWYNKGVTTDDYGNQYELAGDSKAEWENFRKKYYLDSSGDDYVYRRKPTLGVLKQSRDSIMAALENGVKAALQNKLSIINQSLQESRVNKFGSGGDTKATLKGKVGFNPFKAFNRNYRGTNIYESDNFGDAFRQARIDGEDRFVWNGNIYSTELKPNEFVEAAKGWDTQGDLAKEDFKMSIIRNPQGVLDYYNSTYPKGEYKTANRRINEYDIPFMYSLGTKGIEDLVINKYTNQTIGDAIWAELANTNLSYEQKIAILANSYHETNGWTALKQYNNGPASGIYMMEDPQKEVYNDWLSANNLTDSYANQTKFVVSLFDSEDPSLKTAWDRAGDKQEEIRAYKDANEAKTKGYRSAYNHMDYTTKQAFKDWNSSDLDATTTAFEGLFERAGVPALENRKRIAHILSKKYK